MSNEARFPEDRAREILQRAAEIDRRETELTSVNELRNAATDAGISPTAFEAALRELGEVSTANAPVSRRRVLLRAAGATAGLVGLYAFIRNLRPREVTAPSPVDTPLSPQR